MFSFCKTAFLLLPTMLFGLTPVSEIVHAADTIRDPMQPPAFALKQFRLAKTKLQGAAQVKKKSAQKATGKSLRLSTVLIGKGRKVAIINDRMLVVGDKIDDAKVVKILKDRVELIRKGKRIILILDNSLISVRKNPAKSNL